MSNNDPKREFFESLGQLIFWSIVFGLILVGIIIVDDVLIPLAFG